MSLVPARIFESAGKVRVPLVVGLKTRKMGLAPLSTPRALAAPRSRSSHEYVNASPLGSVAVAESANGVLRGMVRPLAVGATKVIVFGMELPVLDCTAQ